jgi:hypothetical protein
VNRAWIPAGALAGVSVAGLMAHGPLTDSLTAPVSFEPRIAVPTGIPSGQAEKPVSLKIDQGTTGSLEHAALPKGRGGRANAAPTTAGVNGDQGAVGFRITHPTPHATSTVPTTPSTNTTATKPPTAAVKPRQNSIGGSSGPNGDNGLAGGSSGSTSVGAQSGTPGNDGP